MHYVHQFIEMMYLSTCREINTLTIHNKTPSRPGMRAVEGDKLANIQFLAFSRLRRGGKPAHRLRR
jgi:hypothetical protein